MDNKINDKLINVTIRIVEQHNSSKINKYNNRTLTGS